MTQSHLCDQVHVDLKDRSYDIFVGENLLDNAGQYVQPLLRRPRTVIVTDETVARHHLPRLQAALKAADIDCDSIVLPPGESSKSFAGLENLLDQLLARRLERQDMIVALGGGVIGDLAGFAASIYQRGIDFIQMPTTLLSQVDSSVGGKTGINTARGKNLVGSFHQPRLVLADVTTLDTLTPRHRLAGYAEVVKYGLLGDADFFGWLEQNGTALLAGNRQKQIYAIKTSCLAKAAIVAEDEKESGRRALLNLGHTFAHALEAESGFGETLYHGEAVAIGMVMAFDLSVKLGLCPGTDAERVRQHLTAVGLPTRLRGDNHPVAQIRMTVDSLMHHMAQDKKIADGRMTYVLTSGIGAAFLTQDVDPEQVKTILAESLAENSA
ncbi:3-dehydroquinate synthase [Luteithermobacter gelatinilyticus]|uniref:3-dehydroquinate synthase n=1 Tax=Luteithermobacter gelatinilyticus TaxID=2582913 RepID=UPI0011061A4E|nr:3-dehydroquinate synthase [Luteithermobacter gelatinilyticus]